MSILEELYEELGPSPGEDPVAADVEYMLAFGYWVHGEEDKAMALAQHGYETHEEPFGKGSRARLIGMCHLTQGHVDEGIRFFEEALELMEGADPLASSTTGHTLDLAALYRDKERWAEVATLLEKVLTGYRVGKISATVDNYDVFQVRWSLSIAYWHEKRFEDAREQLAKFRGYEPLFSSHPFLQQSAGQAAAIVNYMDENPEDIAAGDVSLEDIVGVVRDDWRYQGLMYKGSLGGRGWGSASAR
ncbi:tetratricopeptide repeat protein [Streptomyces sp. NPDC050211]|uniref:tetratricopeptide repeat protein n=1 Tax=Streptomyces sp. NPDC050211 TaxID=3154932 RepID=UPI0034283EA9